jgi:hypothetical protein
MANQIVNAEMKRQEELEQKRIEFCGKVGDFIPNVNLPDLFEAAKTQEDGFIPGLKGRPEYESQLVRTNRALYEKYMESRRGVSAPASVVLAEPLLPQETQRLSTSMFSFWKTKSQSQAPENTKIAAHKVEPTPRKNTPGS